MEVAALASAAAGVSGAAGVSSAVPAILSGVSGVAGAIGSAQQSRGARQHQAAEIEQRHRQATLRQQIEERRLERERRSAEASARARLGAAGVGSGSGSGEAVLLGLNRRHDQTLADSRRLFNASRPVPNLLEDESPFSSILGIGQRVFELGSVINDQAS